ncbi:MAG: OmpH family outer membrane protein [Chitinophagales bacterium]
MKNTVLIVWNLVLTAIIAFLFFYVFAEKKERAENDEKKNLSGNAAEAHADSSNELRIAYVNVDSLENNYALFASKKKELEAKQQQSEAVLNKKVTAFQNDYTSAQQQAATMTETQLQAIQEKLQKQQAEIQQLQTALQADFQNQLEKFNIELKDSLDSYLKTYNSDNRFTYVLSYSAGSDILYAQPQFDITADAVKGMNERLQK